MSSATTLNQNNSASTGGSHSAIPDSLSLASQNTTTSNANSVSTALSSLVSQSIMRLGHCFIKKSFHKPSYCHHCGEMVWGLLGGPGFICDGKFILFMRLLHDTQNALAFADCIL